MPNDPEHRRRTLPGGLLGMIGLVLAVELGLAHAEQGLTTIWAAAWKHSGWAAAKKAPLCEILCFGDSLVKHGIVPRIIQERTGRRCYNLAAFMGVAPSSYYMLKRALESGSRPRAVLIDGEVLDGHPMGVRRLWPEMVTLRDLWELSRTAKLTECFSAMAIARLLPSARLRFELRSEIMAALGGTDPETWKTIASHRRNWLLNLGADLMRAEDRPPAEDPRPALIANLEPTSKSWACEPTNAEYTRRFLQLALDHAIPVFWLLPPIHPAFQAQREQGGRDGAYMRFVGRLQRRFPNVMVVDGRHAGYDPSALADVTHLNRRGAVAFSAALADILAVRLAIGNEGPRWVELSDFRDDPLAVLIEDVSQSHAAILARIAAEEGVRR